VLSAKRDNLPGEWAKNESHEMTTATTTASVVSTLPV